MGTRYQQPQAGVRMARGNPITRDAYAWLPSSPLILFGKRTLNAVGETAYNSSPVGDKGVARKWSRSANAGVDFGTVQPISQNAGVTVLVVAAPSSAASMKVPFSQRIGSGSYTQTDFVFNAATIDSLGATAGQLALTTYHGGSGGVLATGQVDGKTHCWVAGNGPSNGYIIRDGVKQTLAASTRMSTFTGGTQKLRIGNIADDTTTTYPCDDPVYLVVVWDRLLAETEALSVSASPWQLFESPSNVVLLRALAGGSSATLAGNAAAIVAAAGDLSVAVPLAGAAVSTVTASGTLSTALPLSGVAAAVAAAVGSLNVGIALSGGALAQMSAAGDLSIQFALAGNALARVVATGNLNPGNSNALAGDARAQASAAGALSVSVPLAGNAQVVAGATGNIGLGIPLQGAAVVVTAAGGNLLVTVRLSGSALARAIAAGGLALAVPLQGAAISHAVASGALSTNGSTSNLTVDHRYIASSLRRTTTARRASRNFTATR